VVPSTSSDVIESHQLQIGILSLKPPSFLHIREANSSSYYDVDAGTVGAKPILLSKPLPIVPIFEKIAVRRCLRESGMQSCRKMPPIFWPDNEWGSGFLELKNVNIRLAYHLEEEVRYAQQQEGSQQQGCGNG
jgi:hypothetical protein